MDGETAANPRLSVRYNGCKSVRGVGNPVHVSTRRPRRRLSALAGLVHASIARGIIDNLNFSV